MPGLVLAVHLPQERLRDLDARLRPPRRLRRPGAAHHLREEADRGRCLLGHRDLHGHVDLLQLLLLPLPLVVEEELLQLRVDVLLLQLLHGVPPVVLEAVLEYPDQRQVHVALALVLETHLREDAGGVADQRCDDGILHLQHAPRIVLVLDGEEDEPGKRLLGPHLRVARVVVGVTARLHVPSHAELCHHLREFVCQLRALELAEPQDDRRARLVLQGVVLDDGEDHLRDHLHDRLHAVLAAHRQARQRREAQLAQAVVGDRAELGERPKQQDLGLGVPLGDHRHRLDEVRGGLVPLALVARDVEQPLAVRASPRADLVCHLEDQGHRADDVGGVGHRPVQLPQEVRDLRVAALRHDRLLLLIRLILGVLASIRRLPDPLLAPVVLLVHALHPPLALRLLRLVHLVLVVLRVVRGAEVVGRLLDQRFAELLVLADFEVVERHQTGVLDDLCRHHLVLAEVDAEGVLPELQVLQLLRVHQPHEHLLELRGLDVDAVKAEVERLQLAHVLKHVGLQRADAVVRDVQDLELLHPGQGRKPGDPVLRQVQLAEPGHQQDWVPQAIVLQAQDLELAEDLSGQTPLGLLRPPEVVVRDQVVGEVDGGHPEGRHLDL
mmetsp:Transcript_45255/g.119555  ORF Transcript_45255/g.119555 Transcript_45255/m.119555 type:complete len:610 (-) Transcript_45255:427-2256(-)